MNAWDGASPGSVGSPAPATEGGSVGGSNASVPLALVPGPRAAHSCTLVGAQLFVFGGWNGKAALNDLHILDVDSMQWKTPDIEGAPPTARNNHSTALVGSKLFVHGGHDGGKWLADLHALDVERFEWVLPVVAQNPPSARACHTLTRLERKLFMFGGYDGAKCFNSLDVLDLDTMTWITPRVSGAVPLARNAHTMTRVGTRLFLFGGHSGSKHLRDLHILETHGASDTMVWSAPAVSGTPPPGLRGHTANLVGDKIFLFGGYDGRGRSNDLYVLSSCSLKWQSPPANEFTPAGRQRHTACLVGSRKLFVMGGFDGYKWLNDIHILDVSKLEETEITHTAVAHLIGNLRSLLNNASSFPDVVFVVEDRQIYAHKAILTAQCDQFKAMFMNGMRESREAEIEIHGWSYSAFLSMLEFLYTGSVSNFDAQLALDLLGLADHYTLAGLKRLCENTLVHSVDDENVCMLFSTAHKFQASELKHYSLTYILKNYAAVTATKGFAGFTAEPELLLEVTRASMARNRGLGL